MHRIKKIFYSKSKTGAIMASPGLLLLLAFVVIPFVLAIGYSFTDRTLVVNPVTGTQFIGFKNYQDIFSDGTFFTALKNTLYFSILAVPIQTALALGLAMLVNQKLKHIGIFRTIFFSPVVIPMIVVSITWSLMFNPTEGGFINTLLNTISFGHIDVIKWLYDAKTAMLAIVILSVWQGVGYQMVIFLSGLQSVNSELYEAAEIDGAGLWKKFLNITLPQIRNSIIFVFISSTIMSLKLFTQVLVLTQGGPMNSTTSIVYQIFKSGYIDQRLGYASAIAVVFFIIVFLLSLIQQKLTRFDES